MIHEKPLSYEYIQSLSDEYIQPLTDEYIKEELKNISNMQDVQGAMYFLSMLQTRLLIEILKKTNK